MAVANAPCSYGADEPLDAGVALPDPLAVLDHMAASGYAGTDLGERGYFGTDEEVAERLAGRGLSLAGAFFEAPLARGEGWDETLPELDALLDLFDRVTAATSPCVAPKPTLADGGSPARRSAPGRAAKDAGLGLDEWAWRRLAERVRRLSGRCRDRGYEPTFHHHVGTYVEAPWEIERLLELTDVGLCLDTGHLLLGGGEAIQGVRAWGARINHVHLKDCRIDGLGAVVLNHGRVAEQWGRPFRRLGDGEVDVEGLLESLADASYAGWLVVEQDTSLDAAWPLELAFADQAANRAFLRERGL